MSQKVFCILGLLLSVFLLVNLWFMIPVNPLWAYGLMVALTMGAFAFFSILVLKIRILQSTKNEIVHNLNSLKEKYLIAKEEKDRIFQVISNFNDGIILVNSDGVIKNVNFQAEKILGIPATSLLHKSVLELKHFLDAGCLVPFLLRDSETIKKEIAVNANLILEISVYFLVIHSIIFDKKDIAKCVILRDITKEKAAAKKGADLISLTTHQLNAPLAAMKLSLEMLLAGDFGKITKQQRNIIEKMYQRDKMMVSLVSGLLHVAKIEEEGYAYHQTQVDFEELVKSVINFNEEEIKIKKIAFTFNKPASKLPEMLLDKEKMFLAIQNIVDNAVKYTPIKGKISLSLSVHGDDVECKVQDSGIGIPESQRDKLFSKFFRAANATKMEVGGSGLGLFITKNIIEAHGGKIWFTSKENQGSTFTIILPVK